MKLFSTGFRNTFSILVVLLLVSCGKTPKPLPKFSAVKTIPRQIWQESSTSASARIQSSSAQIRPFKLEKPNFKKLKSGNFLPEISQSKWISQWNRPRLPVLAYAFQVPKGYQATLQLKKPEMEVSDEPIELAKASKPLVWNKNKTEFNDTDTKDYFPGKLFDSYQSGETVYVSLYPIQVETKSGKVFTLVKGDWELNLVKKPRKPETSSSAAAIILTPERLRESAVALQKFHSESLGTNSLVQTVEEIDKTEEPIELAELPEGYKKEGKFSRIVKAFNPEKQQGYNFNLARKIITYLRKKSEANSKLKYVVILGNSELVPPSYYFYDDKSDEERTGVTDQCYSAGKKCLEPKLAVGRLPFTQNEQVIAYLEKTQRWLRNKEKSENELSLYGGKAFPTSPYYIGELGTLVTLDKGNANWKQVSKHFQTDQNYTKEEVNKLVSGDEKSTLVYYLDHGLGNRLFIGEQSVSSFDILNSEPKEDSLPPIMVSVSCINAAFDEHLLLDNTIDDIGEHGVVSIGTALLRSKAGAIAYIGGARDGLGTPETEVDEKGNLLVLGTSYGLQLFDGFVGNYADIKEARLGDVFLKSLTQYAYQSGNDMEDFNHRWTFWITELLGDPVLPVRRRPGATLNHEPAKSEFPGFDVSSGYARLDLMKARSEKKSFLLSKPQSIVTAKIYEMLLGEDGYSGEKLLKSEKIEPSAKAELGVDPADYFEPGKQYLIKLVNEEGVPRERHIVFSTKD